MRTLDNGRVLAAAYLIVREAGGVVIPVDRSELFPLAAVPFDYGQAAMPIVAAANQSVLDTVTSALNGK